jgi:phosphoserine phosphatase RsbU/P
MTDQSSASHLLEMQTELDEREAELALINSVQQALASKLDVQAIYDLVGDRIRDIFDSQVVMISTYDPATDTMEHRYAIERGERINAPGRFPVKGFRTQIVLGRKPVLVSTDVAAQAAKLGQPTLAGTVTPKTWLGVPMIVGDQVTGILSLQDVEKEFAFDESDVRLLQTLAASMGVALDNARLWEQEKLFRKALEREFEIGREIQAGFLPDRLPRLAGWELATSMKSAREVTGDFYDVFELCDGKIGLVIADVCDKGLGAALFMTVFRTLIRSVANIDFFTTAEYEGQLSAERRIKNAMSLTNNYFAETHGRTSMFCTIFFGILDTTTGVLTYSNGGHIPPLVVNGHGIKETLTPTGPAVGLTTGAVYAVRTATVEPDELFFANTDGLTEAVNVAGDFFNRDTLIPQLMVRQTLPSLLEQIQGQVKEFSAGAKETDDITMLAVRRNNL